MLVSNLALLLLIAHVLSDFQGQSDLMAKNKATAFIGLLPHAVVLLALHLAAAIAMYFAGFPGTDAFLITLAIVCIHLLLDAVKYVLTALREKVPEALRRIVSDGALFVADQILHVLFILLIADIYYGPRGAALSLPRAGLKWTLLILLVTKPANISFKRLFSRYQTAAGMANEASKQPEPGAGALIGNLERLLALLFLSLGQYAAIGLVFTAKSIARFKQIEENRRFAEYYLIGTLFSMLFVIAFYLLIFVAIG